MIKFYSKYFIVGLFNNLSSGVAELFYEPWQGFIMSDRPQDLGMGIARVNNINDNYTYVFIFS